MPCVLLFSFSLLSFVILLGESTELPRKTFEGTLQTDYSRDTLYVTKLKHKHSPGLVTRGKPTAPRATYPPPHRKSVTPVGLQFLLASRGNSTKEFGVKREIHVGQPEQVSIQALSSASKLRFLGTSLLPSPFGARGNK